MRTGSGLVLHHWMPPAEVPDWLPSSRLLVMAKQEDSAQLPVHAEIQRLWARDVPIWLASGHVDSIQLLSEHLTHDGSKGVRFSLPLEPDPGRFRGPLAQARTLESIYWQVLEAGLRIPPSAGSGFGRGANPLGYNRVYVHANYPKRSAWWQALRDGRSFVTSGPLLRSTINGYYPGHLFQFENSMQLSVELTLTVADPVDYVDVVFNGKTLYQARLDEHARRGGRIPQLVVEESGWLVIRVITAREATYRIATTAPFYFESQSPAGEAENRISRSACEFFLRWLEHAEADIQEIGGKLAESSTVYLNAAKKYWQQKIEAATVE